MFEMFDPNLAKQIEELTKMVSELNKRDFFDWLSLIVPSILSITSFWFGYKISDKQQRERDFVEYQKEKYQKIYKSFINIKSSRHTIWNLISNIENKEKNNAGVSDTDIHRFNESLVNVSDDLYEVVNTLYPYKMKEVEETQKTLDLLLKRIISIQVDFQFKEYRKAKGNLMGVRQLIDPLYYSFKEIVDEYNEKYQM